MSPKSQFFLKFRVGFGGNIDFMFSLGGNWEKKVENPCPRMWQIRQIVELSAQLAIARSGQRTADNPMASTGYDNYHPDEFHTSH